MKLTYIAILGSLALASAAPLSSRADDKCKQALDEEKKVCAGQEFGSFTPACDKAFKAASICKITTENPIGFRRDTVVSSRQEASDGSDGDDDAALSSRQLGGGLGGLLPNSGQGQDQDAPGQN